MAERAFHVRSSALGADQLPAATAGFLNPPWPNGWNESPALSLIWMAVSVALQ
jgi:hypothetical protein